ncbi:hypothetical protein CYMTET_33370 [Cymbomonas tetramitiformis]|uniref:Helicase C-terminal domain-containing protein n=1 Tax=Cymbomonas tetramitiformis TaxID=36881 RepID=A0AAE0KR91_9CHLO|nr:hypothetical protein CYMTET_33370 [Cymbomonas tetramitiformis]
MDLVFDAHRLVDPDTPIPIFRTLYNILRDLPSSQRIILYTSDRRRPTLLLLLLTLQHRNPDRLLFRELTPSSPPTTDPRKLKNGYVAADIADSLLWKSVTHLSPFASEDHLTADDTLRWFNRQDADDTTTKLLVLSTEPSSTDHRGIDTTRVDITMFFSQPNAVDLNQAAGRGVRMAPEPNQDHFIVYFDRD